MDFIGNWTLPLMKMTTEKGKNSAQNYSLMNKIALSILKNHQHKDQKASIKRKRMKAAWDEDYLKSLLISWIKAF